MNGNNNIINEEIKNAADENPNDKKGGRIFCIKFFFLYILAGAVFAVLHTILLWKGYNTSDHLFEYNLIGITRIFYLLTAAVMLAACAIYPFTSSSKLCRKSFLKGKAVFMYAFCGFTILAVTVFEIIFPSVNKIGNGTFIPVLFKISGIPFAVFFFCMLGKGETAKKAQTVLGFFPIIWCILKLICIYFDHTRPIGDPVKILSQVLFVSVMCYFLAEQRYRIEKPLPRTYFVIACIAEFMLIFTAVPEAILIFSGRWAASSETVSLIMEIALAGYIASRVLSFRPKKKQAKKTVEKTV